MLPHAYRLPATISLTKANHAKNSLFGVKYIKNGLNHSRFAFLVRKSIDKRAVVRNRIRRIFRSCIEELGIQIDEGYDMLFFLEKGIMNMKREELLVQVKNFLREKQLIK